MSINTKLLLVQPRIGQQIVPADPANGWNAFVGVRIIGELEASQIQDLGKGSTGVEQ